MKEKKVSESRVVHSHVMQPQDANPAGNVHGGVIMKHIDNTASVVAAKHARSNVVTLSIDRLVFHNPVYIGDLLTLKANLNLAGRTSMEVGVRVEAENLLTGKMRHTASAFLTFVALDEKGVPFHIPDLIPETEEDARRITKASARRERRLAEKEAAGE